MNDKAKPIYIALIAHEMRAYLPFEDKYLCGCDWYGDDFDTHVAEEMAELLFPPIPPPEWQIGEIHVEQLTFTP